MRIVELARTTSFRLALLFLALFGIASVVLYTFIDLQVRDFLSDKVDEWVMQEGKDLAGRSAADITNRLTIRRDQKVDVERPITLFDANGHFLAGAPTPFPDGGGIRSEPTEFLPPGGPPLRGRIFPRVDGTLLLVAQNVRELNEFNEVLFSAMLFAAICTGTLGLAGALVVGTSAVRHLDAITKATRDIVAGDLSGRLPQQNVRGDIGRLVSVVNEMLDEIERLMREVKSVCDNIAHDLRTPLTRLLAGLERTRRRSTTAEEYAASIDEGIAETKSILKTFAALLQISELEDGQRRSGFVPVRLGEIVVDAVELYEPLAEEKGITLVLEMRADESVPAFSGDPSLLFEAVANLIDNAIKFTPPGGHVAVRLRVEGRNLVLDVADNGPGIAEADRSNVLRRFYRAEPSRHTPGNGLGLSLVAAIARLHAMKLEIGGPPGCIVSLERDISA